MRMGCEVYHALKGLIKAKYGEEQDLGAVASVGLWRAAMLGCLMLP